MKVYHTSPVIVENPDIAHSRDFLDFGSGFYVTTMLKQAKSMVTDLFVVVKTPFLISMSWQTTSLRGKLLSLNITMKHGLIL